MVKYHGTTIETMIWRDLKRELWTKNKIIAQSSLFKSRQIMVSIVVP